MTSDPQTLIQLGNLRIEPNPARGLLIVENRQGQRCEVVGPVFEVNGVERSRFYLVASASERSLHHGGQELELVFESIEDDLPKLQLHLTLQGFPNSGMLRLRYRLTALTAVSLTKSAGHDHLRYLAVSSADCVQLNELALSHYDPVQHSYFPQSEAYQAEELFDGFGCAGPIVVLQDRDGSRLLAFEHGSEHPDSFLEFQHHDTHLELWARKGNYYHGQIVSETQPWESVWLELGLFAGSLEDVRRSYRHFVLHELCPYPESRKPYIFYNTWNHQERQRYFAGKPYLDAMQLERITAEIEIAHRLGVEVFVLDAGWFGKTGDWLVNLERFPDGLQQVRRDLETRGMKLGLWLNPTMAAVGSAAYRTHQSAAITRNGRMPEPQPVWETEVSHEMCLVSSYSQHVVDTMRRLNRELGISYFKWDGLWQYQWIYGERVHPMGCDCPDHQHGNLANSAAERLDCYAFEVGRSMVRIAEQVLLECPDVIIDFDITENGRFVGLGFLSVGKYFLCNNGPYFADFDIPPSTQIQPDTINAFFYPGGAARSRVCRKGTLYDPWIPSVLFLTHYYPDGPAHSQRNNLAALTLGGNGLWGDLLALSQEDIAFWREQLEQYKYVAAPITEAAPLTRGSAGASPEIIEKIQVSSGLGVVSFFTVAACQVTHLTQPILAPENLEISGADAWSLRADGRIKISVNLERNDARTVFVGRKVMS